MPRRSAHAKRSLSVSFAATLENLDKVCEEVKKISAENGFGQSSFVIQLVLREALNNAVIHGDKGNPEKLVKCRVSYYSNNNMRIAVEDEGDGFEWRKIMEREVSSCAGSGRGIAIMKQYGKEIRFNKKGNKVVLEIDVSQGGTCGRDRTEQ
jgi:serine/threonine-protein kinase RsbW